MRAIFSKRNVRRAPGQSGQLKRFRHNIYGTESWMYMSAKGTISPWPASLVIQVSCLPSHYAFEMEIDCGRPV
jgi:linoleate 10R-lipoxygenase